MGSTCWISARFASPFISVLAESTVDSTLRTNYGENGQHSKTRPLDSESKSLTIFFFDLFLVASSFAELCALSRLDKNNLVSMQHSTSLLYWFGKINFAFSSLLFFFLFKKRNYLILSCFTNKTFTVKVERTIMHERRWKSTRTTSSHLIIYLQAYLLFIGSV